MTQESKTTLAWTALAVGLLGNFLLAAIFVMADWYTYVNFAFNLLSVGGVLWLFHVNTLERGPWARVGLAVLTLLALFAAQLLMTAGGVLAWLLVQIYAG